MENNSETLCADPLLPVEVSRYRECNATIKGGLATFYAVGNALREVRENRYYREEYPSFESYCKEKWDIGRGHAARLIGSAEVVDNLSPNEQLPTSERQARELVSYDAEAQKAIWKVVTCAAPLKGTRITADYIKRVAIQLSGTERSTPKLPDDAYIFKVEAAIKRLYAITDSLEDLNDIKLRPVLFKFADGIQELEKTVKVRRNSQGSGGLMRQQPDLRAGEARHT